MFSLKGQESTLVVQATSPGAELPLASYMTSDKILNMYLHVLVCEEGTLMLGLF
jgi:hypothetical protein